MDWISSLLLATVRLAIPVLLISLAELYGQRAGMVNIGLEGLASIGALVGFLVCYVTGSNWLGLLCGALAGVIVNMIYAFSTVTLCADHTVYGMALNIFAPALASFIYRVYFGTGSDLKQITTMSSVAIPGLKDIPVLGPLLFDQSPMVYLTFLLVLFTAIFFGKTRAGLSYKAVGEHPQAAATLGIPVVGVKYLACVICGALSGIGGAIRPGIVHRIDKDTSGLLVVAKNDAAHQALSAQMSVHSIHRVYHAVVYGNLKEDEGFVEKWLGRDPRDRKKMAVLAENAAGAKYAYTGWQVLERCGNFTYIACKLKTGRTHQIRVHMASTGHPLAGDAVYGPKNCIKSLNGQCLHAKELGFVHPRTGEWMQFDSPLPPYFTEFLTRLRKEHRA